jgi:hypothetical protein
MPVTTTSSTVSGAVWAQAPVAKAVDDAPASSASVMPRAKAVLFRGLDKIFAPQTFLWSFSAPPIFDEAASSPARG